MAVLLPLLVCALLSLTVSAYPGYDDVGRWSPQDLAEYLYQMSPDTTPLEDPNFSTDGLSLGTVSAVDVDSKGDLYIFHRGSKPWDVNTFLGNELSPEDRIPIEEDAIVKVNPFTGAKVSSFGKGIFNVPHGLKIDSQDNIWVTDVGRHQVLRFSNESSQASLVLGEQFVSGSDQEHFCKPTDVAVASNGVFFVSDGYCNSRVMKFTKEGKFLNSWGVQTRYELTPYTLNLPHSITLIEEMDLVCVADRENRRALCYNAGLSREDQTGVFNRTLIPQNDMGKVFGIYYNKAAQEVIASGEVARTPYIEDNQYVSPPRAFTYNLNGIQTEEWAKITPATAANGPSLIHDLCASKDGKSYYLADLIQRRVLKFDDRRAVQGTALDNSSL